MKSNKIVLGILVVGFFLASAFLLPKKIIEGKTAEGGRMQYEAIENPDGTLTKDGFYKTWYLSGMLWVKAIYKNNILHGSCTIFYESGSIDRIAQYMNGKFVGKYQEFNEDKSLSVEHEYGNDGLIIWKKIYGGGKPQIKFNYNADNKVINLLGVWDIDGDIIICKQRGFGESLTNGKKSNMYNIYDNITEYIDETYTLFSVNERYYITTLTDSTFTGYETYSKKPARGRRISLK